MRMVVRALVGAALVASGLSVGTASVAAPASQSAQRYIVVLHDGVDPDRAANDHARSEGARVELIYRHALRGYAATMAPAAAARIAARDGRVDFVEADQVVEAFGEVPTGVDRMEVDKALSLSDIAPATDVDVAVIDTGIDHTHPDLDVRSGVDCTAGTPLRASCKAGFPGDSNGHGTHVAGSIAAKSDGAGVVGVAPGSRLHAVKVLGNNGSGYMSWIAAGIDWVTARASTIEVANMSLGCKCSSAAMDQALTSSADAGVVYLAAAGNSNEDAAGFSPANHPKTIAVGALADFDGKAGGTGSATCRVGVDETRADFSNYGSTVDIAAPGVCIRSTWPGGRYAITSGTSMASPHAAGAAALYIVQNKTLKAASRWSTVKAGLQSAVWSVPASDACGYTADDGKPIGRLLLLAPCDTTSTGDGGGGGDPDPGDPTPPGTNTPPTATITSTTCQGPTCTFTGSGSDAEDQVVTLTWSGATGSGDTATQTYTSPGTYTVTLTATDSQGATGSTSTSVSCSWTGKGKNKSLACS